MKSPILVKAKLPNSRHLQFYAPRTYPDFLRKLHRLSEDYSEVRVWYKDEEGQKVLFIEETYGSVLSLWPWLELRVEVERVDRSAGQWARREALKVRVRGLIWMRKAKECGAKAAVYCRGKWEIGLQQASLCLKSAQKRLATWSTQSYGVACQYSQRATERIQPQKRQFACLMILLVAICAFSLTAQSLSTSLSYTGQWKNGVYEGIGELRSSNWSYSGEFVAGKATGKGLQRTSSGIVSSGSFLDGKLHGFGCVFKEGSELCGEFSQGLCQGKAVRRNAGKTEVVSCNQGRESKDSWW